MKLMTESIYIGHDMKRFNEIRDVLVVVYANCDMYPQYIWGVRNVLRLDSLFLQVLTVNA